MSDIYLAHEPLTGGNPHISKYSNKLMLFIYYIVVIFTTLISDFNKLIIVPI